MLVDNILLRLKFLRRLAYLDFLHRTAVGCTPPWGAREGGVGGQLLRASLAGRHVETRTDRVRAAGVTGGASAPRGSIQGIWFTAASSPSVVAAWVAASATAAGRLSAAASAAPASGAARPLRPSPPWRHWLPQRPAASWWPARAIRRAVPRGPRGLGRPPRPAQKPRPCAAAAPLGAAD